MTVYLVTDWNKNYENNRSRKVKDLAWVPVPNKHDGERYSRLMHRKDAAQIFSAWILILQVASRCHPRGSLVRSDGSAHDAESLSIKTRAPQTWFESALPVLADMTWLSSKVVDEAKAAPSRHNGDTTLPLGWQAGDEEGKGIEGKGREPSSAPPTGEKQDPRHHLITQKWGELYEGAFGGTYSFSGKDAATLKRFLGTTADSADDFFTIAIRAWERTKQDRYAKQCKQASTIHGLCVAYNEIRVELQTPLPVTQDVIGKRSSMAS